MKKILTRLYKLLPLLVLVLTFTKVNAQTATAFQTNLQNVVQTTDRTLEFDLYLLNTDPIQPMELATYSAGITLNPAIYAGGTLSASIVAGSSALTNTSQIPTSVTYTASATIIKLAAKAPPGAGSGSIISQSSPGTRIITLRLTSSVPFAVNSTADFFLAPSTALSPSYPTTVALYVGGINTQLPVTMGTNAFVLENPALNPPLPPIAYAVTGGGSYVQGGVGLPVGLANSELGATYTLYKNSVAQVPTIAGTGLAITFGNQLAGTYTVTGTNGNGTTNMTGSAQITLVSFQTTLQNIVQTSDRTLEFDLYLLNTDIVHPMEMATYQAGITLNPAIYAGGTLSASIVAGTSTLTNLAQVPTGVSYTASATIVKLAAKTPPGAGGGSIISQVSPGTRIITLRLTSSVPFASNSTADFFLAPSTAIVPSYPTAVALYVGGLNTQMPVEMGVNAFVLENPILNPPVPPIAYAVTGGGSYCQGTGGLPVGLSNSEVGVTYTLFKGVEAQIPTVAGTGTAITFDNQLAGTYTVSGDRLGLTTVMTGNAVITEIPAPDAPTASLTQPDCTVATGTITVTSPLTGLSFSIDGIDYTNTTGIFTGVVPGTYSLTAKNAAGCVSLATAVTINPAPAAPAAPTADLIQPDCTVATGTITVTSPLTGLSFSIDGLDYTNTTGIFTGVVPGTYNLTAKNAAGCVSLATAVTINPAPAAPAAPTADLIQPDCTVATGTITVTSPLTGLSFSIDGLDYTNTTGIFTGVVPGTYNLTAKNAAGCVSLATSVTINPAPSAPAAPTASLTQPDCTVATGTITVTSPLTGLSFSIDGIDYTNTTGIFTGVVPGTYNLTAKNAAGCVSLATSVTINPAPAAPDAPTASLIQPDCTVATGTITVSSPVTGLSFSIDGLDYTNTTGIFTGVVPGTYNLTAMNADGCVSLPTSVTINPVPAAPDAPTASLIQPDCTVATGTITVTSPLTGLSFSIDGIDYTNTTGIFTGVVPGTYSLTAKNAAGCVSLATAVTINPAPAAPAAPTADLIQPDCTVATGTITVTSPLTGLSFSIDGLDYTNTTGIFTGVVPGTYNLTAKNAAGCVSLATAVTINPAPSAPAAPTASLTQPDCTVATGTITVTSPLTGLSFSIDGLDYTNTTGIFTGVVPGTYNLTAKNAAGCVSLATSVTINPAPSAPAAPTASLTQPDCTVATGTITVTSPLTGLSFSIDGIDYTNTTGIFTGVAPGTYSLTAKNAAGCVSLATSVTINPAPAAPAAPTADLIQPDCTVATGTITVTSPLTGLSFSIDGIDYTNTTGIFTGVVPGTYSLTAKNAAGCVSLATAVTINPAPAAPAAPTADLIQPDCTVATGTITVSSPVTGLSFSIDGLDYTNTTGIFTGVVPGTYNLTAMNADGCVSLPTSVTINPVPAAPDAPTASLIQPDCTVATGTITVTSPLTGLSFSIDGIDYTNTTGIFTGVVPGTYNLTAKNAAGCVSLATAVTINPAPSAPDAPTASLIQPDCTVATGTITVTSPVTGLSFSIDGLDYTNTTGVFTGVVPGTYNLTAMNAAGCVSLATSVTINPVPAAPDAPTASLTQPDCTVATGTITVSSPVTGLSFSIDGLDYTNTTGIFTGVVPGTYNLTAMNAAGCVSLATSVTINPVPAAPDAPTASLTQPDCTVATGTITVTSPVTGLSFSIDGLDYTNTTGVFTGVVPGTYNLTAMNAAGCVSLATSVTINPVPAAPDAPTASLTQPDCTVATGTITVSSPVTGLSFSIDGLDYTNTTGIFTGVVPGTYNLTAMNAAGCVSLATSVTINPVPAAPDAPTASLTQPDCTVATGTITVTSPVTGLSFSIDGLDYTNTTGVFTGVVPGTYNLTAKNAAGCVSLATAVTINPAPSAPAAPTASLTQPDCTVATGTITVTSPLTGLSFSIDGLDYTNTTGIFTGVVPGTYNLTAKNAAGCVSLATAVTINPTPEDIPVSGTIKYYNTANTPLDNVTIKLISGTTELTANPTDEFGSYSFANVCPGTYNVVITTGKSMGGINSTDAAQVNGWQILPVDIRPIIEKVQFLAGDVIGDLRISSIDASNIQEYFVTLGASPLFDNDWEFWKAGETVNINPQTTNIMQLTITAGSGPVIQNFLGLVSGDFNRSYNPGWDRKVASLKNENLTLLKGENVLVDSGTTIELPIKASSAMQIGAISLILNYPNEKLQIEGVYLKGKPEQPVMFNAKNGELRIGWNSLNPLSLATNETMLTVRLKTTSGMDEGEVSRFELAVNPLNELADEGFDVIQNASLIMDGLELKKDVTVGIDIPNRSKEMQLKSYPNPFRASATIEYTLPEDGHVSLEITSIVGSRITLLSNQQQTEGEYFTNFDGNKLAPGVYQITLRFKNQHSNELTKTIRMVKQ